VVGKPEPGLFTTAASLSHAERPLVVGDRLDTDIQGAVTAGMNSLLVLTGVSSPGDLLAADPARRPTFVAADLSGLFRPADEATVPLKATEAGGWTVTRDGDAVTLDGAGDPVVALRLLCAATWDGVAPADIRPNSDAATGVLGAWGL
jgi:glycerol 3-phosphatase-2